MRRKNQLVNDEIYHVFNKSIAGYSIFNDNNEYLRMKSLLMYYQLENTTCSFTQFLGSTKIKIDNFSHEFNPLFKKGTKIVHVICYCIMPTHIHIALKQIRDNGISVFMGNVLNGYSRYFNIKYKRKGPLWQSRFKNILVENDEQLLHLTRYIHLNPVTANLVNKPEQWDASSYKEFIDKSTDAGKLCTFTNILDIQPNTYSEFVKGGISYQRELALAKHLFFDEEE